MRRTSGRRIVSGVVVAVLVLATLTSCRPRFSGESTLQHQAQGDGIVLSWSPAQTDSDRSVASYRVDVDGAEVTRIDSSVTSCVLTGLDAGVDHDVEVSVYDSTGEWSGIGEWSDWVKSLHTTVTGPVGSDGTAGVDCAAVQPPTAAAVSVAVSEPSPGAGTKVIGGQVAPIAYQLAVANTGETASGEVTVSDPVPVGTTLVAGSPSCGTATDCTVATTDGVIHWTLAGLAAESATDLSFSVTVNSELGTTTSIDNVASFTAAGQSCDTDPCTSNTVTNSAEPWAWTGAWVAPYAPAASGAVTIDPWNSVFYDGLSPTFHAYTRLTNDPAATITVEWSCYPSQICLLLNDPHSRTMQFNFVRDPDDFQNWAMYVTATATQGTRTMTSEKFMEFSLEKGVYYTCGDPPVPC